MLLVNKSRILVLLASLLGLWAGQVQAAKDVLEIVDQPVPAREDGGGYSLGEVRMGIIHGCTKRGWKVRDEGEGKIVASIRVRGKHYAEVSIPYSSQAYSITYLKSDNLDYKARRHRIHRSYNNWVNQLKESIDGYFLH